MTPQGKVGMFHKRGKFEDFGFTGLGVAGGKGRDGNRGRGLGEGERVQRAVHAGSCSQRGCE